MFHPVDADKPKGSNPGASNPGAPPSAAPAPGAPSPVAEVMESPEGFGSRVPPPPGGGSTWDPTKQPRRPSIAVFKPEAFEDAVQAFSSYMPPITNATKKPTQPPKNETAKHQARIEAGLPEDYRTDDTVDIDVLYKLK